MMRGFDKRVAVCLVLLAWVAYGSTANLALISDDYVYLMKAREYGAPSQLGALFADELYRSRATTIWITRFIDHFFGLSAAPYNFISIAIHALNVVLVYGLGRWRVIGYPVAFAAAAFFAVAERPHEAVMWFSALPDLLAFTFSLTAVHGYLGWLEGRSPWSLRSLSGVVASFVLGLLSKESAASMLAFFVLVLLLDPRSRWRHWAPLVPLTAVTGAYAALIFAASRNHLHLNDGTFVLGWHVIPVVLNSAARLFWVWGLAAAALFAMLRPRVADVKPVAFGLLWIVPALAPYSFLSYQGSVPSRHTYIANLGIALLVGAAGYLAWRRWRKDRIWAVGLLAAAMLIHNTGYIWLVKKPAFIERAQYTERLLEEAAHNPATPLHISKRTFPFNVELAHDVILLRTGQDRTVVLEQ